MAEKHHQAGFSAEAFSSYEERLKTAVTRPSPTHPPFEFERASWSTFDESFESVSVLEKGDILHVEGRHACKTRRGPTNSLVGAGSTHLAIPAKRQTKAVRKIRHTYLNVYRRLFSLAFTGNTIALIVWLSRLKHADIDAVSLSDLATAAAVNFLVAILIRQDYIVNALYRICWHVPHSCPLRLRRMLAKVYENGGVHSGCAVAGSLWFLALTVVLSFQFANNVLHSIPILAFTAVLLILLFTILFFAYPSHRSLKHNAFEFTHRFAGWLAIGIFWIDATLIVNEFRKKTGRPFRHEMICLPTFWLLIATTVHLILPWLRLRRWEFQPEQLSTHALRLNFKHTLPPLSGLAISESPLKEWHPFATFPNVNGRGGSMIISNAGDFTARAVLNPHDRYWVKGQPKTGVLSMAFVFRKVAIVTTGSGIGPCLSFMLEPRRRTGCRILWSTPSPLNTYGSEIYNQVMECDHNAIIIDSRASGRPDMVALTYHLFKESEAEAVFCISNPRLTRKIVYAMESRGVPAFGPIWDS